MKPVTFTDTTPVLPVELWDPVTWNYTLLSPIAGARNYHSVGILLPDGRVFCGGGGLCQQGPCRCGCNGVALPILHEKRPRYECRPGLP